jgi:large subunit ribosomal protein L33
LRRARGPLFSLPLEVPPDTTMAKVKKKKEVVFLVCNETGDRNYVFRKKPGSTKLELKKYSPRLRKHTLHTEKKK